MINMNSKRYTTNFAWIHQIQWSSNKYFDEIVDAVQRQQTKLYYIQGQAGSGKSTLAKKILAYSRCLNKLCACCASTGLANSCHSL